MAHNPEQLKGGPEVGRETQEAAAEQAEKLRNRFEKSGEQSSEHKEEQARHEASREALFSKEAGAEKKATSIDNAPVIRRITKKHKEAEFQETMRHVRTHLRAPERMFSKVIHNKTVEKTSDALGASVARPNALLAGGISAFILTGGVYILARTFGYPLSGFETIGAFMIGFVIGILYDFFFIMITGKRT